MADGCCIAFVNLRLGATRDEQIAYTPRFECEAVLSLLPPLSELAKRHRKDPLSVPAEAEVPAPPPIHPRGKEYHLLTRSEERREQVIWPYHLLTRSEERREQVI